jgi:hypothetical protein
MRFALALLGSLALLIGVDLVVFSPVPLPKPCGEFRTLVKALDGAHSVGLLGYWPGCTRFYRRTWPPGVAVGVVGVALLAIAAARGRRRRRPPHAAELPAVLL